MDTYFWEDMFEVLRIIAVVVALLVLGFAAIAVPFIFMDRAGCYQTAAIYEVQADWGLLTGCNVQRPDGRWVSMDAYRGNVSEQVIEGEIDINVKEVK